MPMEDETGAHSETHMCLLLWTRRDPVKPHHDGQRPQQRNLQVVEDGRDAGLVWVTDPVDGVVRVHELPAVTRRLRGWCLTGEY